jgi:hypothetical protein
VSALSRAAVILLCSLLGSNNRAPCSAALRGNLNRGCNVVSYRYVCLGTTIVHLALRGNLNRACNELSIRLLGNNNRAPCSAREPQLWVQRSICLHLLGNNNVHVRVEVLYSSNLIEAKYTFTSTFQNLKSQRANGQPRLCTHYPSAL